MSTRRRELCVGAAFLLTLSSACRQNESTTSTVPTPTLPTPIASPQPHATATAVPAAASTPAATQTLYLWANPIAGAGNLVDHTWVTNFPAGSPCPPPQTYWYSWGGCHETGPGTTARPLASHAANLAVAKCICTPDLGEYSPPESPTHGGINFYGIEGVCHQLSNRILWAATSGTGDPVTVEGAKGYEVSRWMFGIYGTTTDDWQQRIARCAAAAATASATPAPHVMMAMMARIPKNLNEDLNVMMREKLGPQLSADKAARIVQIRGNVLERKSALETQVKTGQIAPRVFATSVNDLVNEKLREASQHLTPDEYRKLFGVAPGERIDIVDPDVAERSRYRAQ
jgi:hypothetical protein